MGAGNGVGELCRLHVLPGATEDQLLQLVQEVPSLAVDLGASEREVEQDLVRLHLANGDLLTRVRVVLDLLLDRSQIVLLVRIDQPLGPYPGTSHRMLGDCAGGVVRWQEVSSDI